MKIRLNLNKNSFYEIPKSIITFLKQTYESNVSIEFLNYFIKLLKEDYKINNFQNYSKEDLSKLIFDTFSENLIFEQKLNEKVVDIFIKFLENNFDKLLILQEFTQNLKDVDPDIKEYEKLFIYYKNAITQIDEKFKQKPEIFITEFEKIDEKIDEEESNDESFIPEHEWDGTKLRFRTSNGKWGKWVDLSPPASSNTKSSGGGGIGRRKIQGMIDSSIETALEEFSPPSSNNSKAFIFFSG